ncbi:MAG TPA: PDZ domain-containing protein [Vicinamibacterales bacterium]
MTAISQTALLCACVLAAGVAPAGAACGQTQDSPDTFVRAFQFAGGSRIGISVQDLDETAGKDVRTGVLVEGVDSGGPGDKAGLKSGDAIVEFDGDRVRSVRQFRRLVEESAPGRAVAMVVMRGGQRVTVNVTPERWTVRDGFGMLEAPEIVRPALPTPPSPPRSPRPAPAPPAFDFFNGDSPLTIVARRGRLGLTAEELSGQLAEYFGVKDGVLVKSVQDGSAAAKAGIKAGDVITSINGSHVYDPSDISRAASHMDTGAEFTVEVIRDHKTQTLKGKIEAPVSRRRSGVRTD